MNIAEITDPLFDKFLEQMKVERETLIDTSTAGVLLPVDGFYDDRDSLVSVVNDLIEMGLKGKLKRVRVEMLGDGEHTQDIWDWLEGQNGKYDDLAYQSKNGDWWLVVNE